jgi:hypothetical protein
LEIADTQSSSNGGDGTTANKLNSMIQGKVAGETYVSTAAKQEQNTTMGKYHTYNCATKEWDLDDENLGKAPRKYSGDNGHGGPGGHGKARDNTNNDSTKSFSSSSSSQESVKYVEIVSGTDENPGKAPWKDSGDDVHGGRGKAKDITNSDSMQSSSSSNSQESGEKVEIVSSINEPDDQKVEILFGWYTGLGFAHSSDCSNKSNASTGKNQAESGKNQGEPGKNQGESGKNQGDSGDKGQVGNASTAKRCTGVCSNGNGATANEGKIVPPHTPASTPTKNFNAKTLVENHRDCGGCIGTSVKGSSTMLVETSKINQKSGRSIEPKTLGHGGTQVERDSNSREDSSNKSNASTGKNQAESGKNQGDSDKNQGESGKNQGESGKNQGDSGDKGQVGNASTAKRCTGVCSNGNGATANEGKIVPPHTPASTPTKNFNAKTLVENHRDCGGCIGTSVKGSSTMLVETSKINQKSGRSIEPKTLGHGGTQVERDSNSREDSSNKSNASTGKNQAESGKNQGDSDKNQGESGKNQGESGKNQGDCGDKGQVGNASTAKRCTGVRSNGNGATANEGEMFPPHTPASTPTKNENVKTLVENLGDSSKNPITSIRVPTKEPTLQCHSSMGGEYQTNICKVPILKLRGSGTEETSTRTGIPVNLPREPTKEPTRTRQDTSKAMEKNYE